MITPKTILLPVDFSSRSASVAAHARILAKQYGSTIVALHVMRLFELAVDGAGMPPAGLSDWYNVQRPALEAKLAEFVKIYLKDLPVKTVFRDGEPSNEILRTANEEHADLIMISTHGYGPFRRFLLGSIAARVLTDSHIPVLTAAHLEVPADEAEHIANVLVAVDMDARASKLIAAGANVAKAFGAELHVVHASPDDGAGVAQFMDSGWRNEVAHKLKVRLEGRVVDAGATAKVHVIPGEPAKVIRQVAEEISANLVVLGRHIDNSFLGRLRTHGYAIVREAPCPVLSI